MTERKPYTLPILKARPKVNDDTVLEKLDAAGERVGYTAQDPAPSEPKAPAKRGRPAKARTATEARPSFGLDPVTHAKFKIWLLKNGVSMQDYLEGHISKLVKDIDL